MWGGAAIMVGVIIGSGIFRTPATIADQMGSPALVLALWAVGGLICLCGALTFAELATMYPKSGGVYVFPARGAGAARRVRLRLDVPADHAADGAGWGSRPCSPST